MIGRAWEGWQLWAQSSRPGDLLKAQKERLGQLFPELEAIMMTPQDKEFHPEGDVWIHTYLVCNAAATIAQEMGFSREERTILLLASLCHDLGKATTTELVDGRIKSHKHCSVGVRISEVFLNKISCPNPFILKILPLVKEHLFHASLVDVTPRIVSRLLRRLHPAPYHLLHALVLADLSGRPPLPLQVPSVLRQVERLVGKRKC